MYIICIYILCMYSRFPYCIYISSNPSIYLSTRMHVHTHTHTHTHTHDTGVGIRIRIHILRTHTHTYTLRHIPTYISESWPAGAGSLCRLMKLLISRREHRLFALPFTKETRLIGDISWRSRNCPCSEDLPIVARFVHYMLPFFGIEASADSLFVLFLRHSNCNVFLDSAPWHQHHDACG